MNYLAHCYLSCSEEDILIGNFMTDFLKKSEEANYTGRILDGIKLHRQIDTFTDTHPASLELRALLRKRHGKYAPVVVDLVWDHFLCLNWNKYSDSSLPSFNKTIYEVLAKRKTELPEKLKGRMDKMIGSDFLMAYANEDNMLKSLKWMDNRVKFQSAFTDTLLDIEDNFIIIDKLFSDFFPDVIRHTEAFCKC